MSTKTGDEVFSPTKIAINYVLGRFWIDFLAILPFDWIPAIGFLSIFGVLKIMRVLRLGSIITKMNIAQETKQSLHLYRLIFNILLLCHLTTCMWYALVQYEGYWIPTYDYITGTTEFFEEDKVSQYISCFYTASLMILGGEVGPRSNI